MKPLLLSLLATLLLAQAATAQTFYRWTDERGVTHYTEEPPEGRDAAEVRTWGRTPSGQQRALEERDQRREQAEAERDATRQQMREAEENQVPRPDPAYCEQLQRNLSTLVNRPVVRMEDPDTGEVITLDAERREQMLAETRDALQACD